jgi:hypothetical protein
LASRLGRNGVAAGMPEIVLKSASSRVLRMPKDTPMESDTSP